MPAVELRPPVAVVAKLGVLEDHHKVKTDEGSFDVVPSEAGGYIVGAPSGQEPGLVSYETEQHVLDIRRPEVRVVIRFRPQTERTTFTLDEHVYDVGTMDFGNVDISERGRPVVRGYTTMSGVRLVSVAPELQPIERELAFGLALHSAWADETYARPESPSGEVPDEDD